MLMTGRLGAVGAAGGDGIYAGLSWLALIVARITRGRVQD
jgi:hypothetical protein